jgi:hypothetical protein
MKGKKTMTQTYEQKGLDHKFELAQSLSAHTPLSGILRGIFEKRHDEGEKVFYAQVDFGPFTVVIPETKFKSDMRSDDRPYVRRVMDSRLGSRVYFVVEGLDLQTKSAVGDSVQANEIRKKYWYKKGSDGEYEMRPGREVTGDVVAIQKAAIIVNVSGVETFIPAKDLTYNRVPHMGKVFAPGESIRLRLAGIFRNEDGSIKFVASHKVFEENPAEEYYDRYLVGSTRVGEVTGIRLIEDAGTKAVKGVKVYVQTSDGVSVQCSPPYGALPQVGQDMSFILSHKDKNERGVFMFGRGLHIYR